MRHLLLRAIIIYTLTLSTGAHSALITQINNLDIAGTNYNVTFHEGSTFNALFDPNANGIFGENDGAIIAHGPRFINNDFLAIQAYVAIAARLGTTDLTTLTGADGFLIPSQAAPSIFTAYGDKFTAPAVDLQQRFIGFISSQVIPHMPIVSIEQSSQTVSEPPSIALGGLALAVMGVMWCRRRVC